MVVFHIVAGGMSLVAGYVALYASKGDPLHRRAGRVFVVVMLAMTASGLFETLVRDIEPAINVPAAVLTAYLVVTGLTTVRPPARGGRGLVAAGMLVAAAVGLVSLALGFEAMALGDRRQGMPAFPFLLFGSIGVLAGVGDLRLLRAGEVRGVVRLRRHLWRMSVALLIAAMSFFFGQADELPRALRIPWLLATPVLAVLVTLVYWLWRVRRRRTGRAVTGLAAAETD